MTEAAVTTLTLPETLRQHLAPGGPLYQSGGWLLGRRAGGTVRVLGAVQLWRLDARGDCHLVMPPAGAMGRVTAPGGLAVVGQYCSAADVGAVAEMGLWRVAPLPPEAAAAIQVEQRGDQVLVAAGSTSVPLVRWLDDPGEPLRWLIPVPYDANRAGFRPQARSQARARAGLGGGPRLGVLRWLDVDRWLDALPRPDALRRSVFLRRLARRLRRTRQRWAANRLALGAALAAVAIFVWLAVALGRPASSPAPGSLSAEPAGGTPAAGGMQPAEPAAGGSATTAGVGGPAAPAASGSPAAPQVQALPAATPATAPGGAAGTAAPAATPATPAATEAGAPAPSTPALSTPASPQPAPAPPLPAPAAPATAARLEYEVQPGDTLFRIAQLFYGQVTPAHLEAIRAANGLEDDRILSGQVLTIPPVPAGGG